MKYLEYLSLLCILNITYFTRLIIIWFISTNSLQTETQLMRKRSSSGVVKGGICWNWLLNHKTSCMLSLRIFIFVVYTYITWNYKDCTLSLFLFLFPQGKHPFKVSKCIFAEKMTCQLFQLPVVLNIAYFAQQYITN